MTEHAKNHNSQRHLAGTSIEHYKAGYVDVFANSFEHENN